MKKRWVISVIFLLILMTSFFLIIQYTGIYPFLKRNEIVNNSYFVSIPVSICSNSRSSTPSLSIQIGDQKILSSLDLGFRGHFSIAKDVLDSIENKTFLGTTETHGFGGNVYTKNIYEIPEVSIGDVSFLRTEIQEESKDFHTNSLLKDHEKLSSAAEPGRIGWEIFQFMNVFIDLANKRIAFCDGLSSLKKNSYSSELFVMAPLILERGFLEIDVESSLGPLRCVLDTGASVSILNIPMNEGKFSYELNKFDDVSTVAIAGRDFGPIRFYHLSIELPIHVDAILGMNFFEENSVFCNRSRGLGSNLIGLTKFY
jgi:hypothetical protein